MLDEVRRAASEVVAAARCVHIDHTRLADYAAALPLEEARAPQLDASTHYLRGPEGSLRYVLTLDAINFGSGYFPWLRKRPAKSGYFTVASSLKAYFEEHGPPSAVDLAALTPEECARIFGQTLDGAAGELMGLFATALNDLGRLVASDYAGDFRQLVDAAAGSAERLAGLLAEGMPFYRDVGFYKRAQLTAADLSTAGVAAFDDLERLTIFADNLVPHVLRMDGVLKYDPELLARINREELIPAGSTEEREIRASALHAVEQLVAELNHQVSPMQLDYLLWNRGQGAQYKAVPRHRTRTVYY